MSDNNSQNGLTNPQVLTALITGMVTVVVAVIGFLPNILNNSNNAPAPTQTPIVIVATATSAPATQVPPTSTTAPTTEAAQPTAAPTNTTAPAQPTVAPTNTTAAAAPAVTTAPTNNPNGNTQLFYDSVSFTLLNRSGDTMTLKDVVFRSTSGTWDARNWGPSLYNKLPNNFCFRVRDATVGSRTPPAACGGNIYALIEVGTTAMFWVGVSSFEVYQGSTLIGTCATDQESCILDIPQ